MSLRYTDPMKDTPTGQLLGMVRRLEKAVTKNYNCMNCSDDDDGCEDCYPVKKSKTAMYNSMAYMDEDKGYKSDRGDKKMPDLPSPKGNKNKIGKGKKPLIGGQKELDKDKDGDIDGDDFKQMKVKKADMDEKNSYCQKHFGCNYSECSSKQKAQCDRVCGKVEKEDATTAFLRERGVFVKYEVEPKESRPQFVEVSGSAQIRSQGYGTNGVLPYTEDATAKKGISEVYKMPSAAQTGYGPDGSTLHMHYTDGGGTADNLDSFEDKLAQIKKSTVGKEGIIEEIASLIEKVYARL